MIKLKDPSIPLPLRGRWDVWERMVTKIDPTANEFDCWGWIAANSGDGYGKISVDGVMCMAHRVAYSILVEPIPPRLKLDHLCRNRACINPLHLEPVTVKINTHRGNAVLFKGADHD